LSLRSLLLFFLLLSSLHSDTSQERDETYSIRVGMGYADMNDLGQILSGSWERYGDIYAVNLDMGYRLIEDLWDVPIDIYLKGGVSYFNEQGYQDDFGEMNVYVKAYWKLDFWQNRVRIGFGEGLSLAQEIPYVETVDATNPDGSVDPTAKFLNYLDISLDLDLGRLVRYKPIYDLYLGYTLKHRSGIFGTFNGVHGGSNYNMFTIEKNF